MKIDVATTTGFETVLPKLDMDAEKHLFINAVNHYYKHSASNDELMSFFDKALQVAKGLMPRFMQKSIRYDLHNILHLEFIKDRSEVDMYATEKIMLDEVYLLIGSMYQIQGPNYSYNISEDFKNSLMPEFKKLGLKRFNQADAPFYDKSKFFSFFFGAMTKGQPDVVSFPIIQNSFIADMEAYFFELVSYEYERQIHKELLTTFKAIEEKKISLNKVVLVDYSFFDGFKNAFLRAFAMNFKENNSMYSITQKDAEDEINGVVTASSEEFDVDNFLLELASSEKKNNKKKRITAYAADYRNGVFD